MTPEKQNVSKILFFGSPEFAVPTLRQLFASKNLQVVGVFTQPDKPSGRSKVLQPTPVKRFALDKGIPIFSPATLKSPEALRDIQSLEPDVIVVVAYGKILPKTVLDIPPKGVLNVHPSLLPQYRGSSPIPYAILDGKKTTGVTIMLLDEEMDHGPILAQEEMSIEKNDTGDTLLARAGDAGAHLLMPTLEAWLCGEITPHAQDHTQATYTKIFTREDGAIDWSAPAETIERKVRALTPWPGTYSFLNDKRVKILETRVLAEHGTEKAGCLFVTSTNEPAVRCGQSSLLLTRVQPEGKKPMSGKEWLHAHSEIVDTCFSS